MAYRTGKAARRWRRIVDDWRRSGLSARQYAQGRGISAQTLYFWSSRLGKQHSESAIATTPPPKFLPVALVETAPAATREDSSALEVVLPGGEVIRVSPGADMHHLGRVVAALRGGTI